MFFPNFMLLIWAPGWYLTYHYWPTSYNTHIFEGTLYFVPPKNATERLRQELAAVTFKEYGLQDGNTLEATQSMIESRAVTQFPLNDQEILLRHLHKTARQVRRRLPEESTRRSAYRPRPERGDSMTTSLPPEFADLEPFSGWCLRTESERYARAVVELDGGDAVVLRRGVPSAGGRARPTSTSLELNALPPDADHLLLLCYSLINVSFPIEVWRQARVPDSGAATMDVDHRARRLSPMAG